MPKNELIIFDLDDTLIDTSDVFWRARTEFVIALSEYGWDTEKIVEIFEEIDTVNIKKMGYSPGRYCRTMKDTYARFLKENSLPADFSCIKRIEKCGDIILNSIPTLIYDAKKLLFWASENYKTALITRGDPHLQRKKIRHHKLAKYFNEIQIVPLKTAEIFRASICRAGVDPKRTWVVGDSIKSDINPGIQASANCILYLYEHPSYRWIQEYGHPIAESFFRARSLSEIIKILQSVPLAKSAGTY